MGGYGGMGGMGGAMGGEGDGGMGMMGGGGGVPGGAMPELGTQTKRSLTQHLSTHSKCK